MAAMHPYDRISAAIGKLCPVVENEALDPLERLAFAVETLVEHVLAQKDGLAEPDDLSAEGKPAPTPAPEESGTADVKAAGTGA